MTIYELPDVIRAKRLEMGLTQRTLAEAAGVSPSAVHYFERRLSVPSLETVAALCRAVGLRLEVREG